MKLSILIPAHNEETTIEQVLRQVENINIGQWEKEVIVINDGSSDRTAEVLQGINFTNLKIIHHKTNYGKGAAIKTGLKEVTGDYVIIQDADLEYDPRDIPKLLSLIFHNQQSLAVFGARGAKSYPERGFHYVIGAKALTLTFNLLFGVWLTDLYTGYKLVPAKAMKSMNLQSTGFEFEAEISAKLRKMGIKIKEVPINYKPRNKEQGKHIRAKDALVGWWAIIKYRFI